MWAPVFLMCFAAIQAQDVKAVASPASTPRVQPTPTPRYREIKLGGYDAKPQQAPPSERQLSDVARGLKLQQAGTARIVIIGQPQPVAPVEPGNLSLETPQERQRQTAKYALAQEIYSLAPKANQLERALRAYYDACAGKLTVTRESEQTSGVAAGTTTGASAGVAVSGNFIAVGAAVSYGEFVASWMEQKNTVRVLENETTIECRTLLSSAKSLFIEVTNARDAALGRARIAGVLPGDEREVLNAYGMNW